MRIAFRGNSRITERCRQPRCTEFSPCPSGNELLREIRRLASSALSAPPLSRSPRIEEMSKPGQCREKRLLAPKGPGIEGEARVSLTRTIRLFMIDGAISANRCLPVPEPNRVKRVRHVWRLVRSSVVKEIARIMAFVASPSARGGSAPAIEGREGGLVRFGPAGGQAGNFARMRLFLGVVAQAQRGQDPPIQRRTRRRRTPPKRLSSGRTMRRWGVPCGTRPHASTGPSWAASSRPAPAEARPNRGPPSAIAEDRDTRRAYSRTVLHTRAEQERAFPPFSSTCIVNSDETRAGVPTTCQGFSFVRSSLSWDFPFRKAASDGSGPQGPREPSLRVERLSMRFASRSLSECSRIETCYRSPAEQPGPTTCPRLRSGGEDRIGKKVIDHPRPGHQGSGRFREASCRRARRSTAATPSPEVRCSSERMGNGRWQAGRRLRPGRRWPASESPKKT